MFFVYAIKSTSRNYIYVGLTENLECPDQRTLYVHLNHPRMAFEQRFRAFKGIRAGYFLPQCAVLSVDVDERLLPNGSRS